MIISIFIHSVPQSQNQRLIPRFNCLNPDGNKQTSQCLWQILNLASTVTFPVWQPKDLSPKIPKTKIIVACILDKFRFHTTNQSPNQSVAAYVTQLQNLAASCRFLEDYLDDALRDRLICGIKSESIQRNLLLEDYMFREAVDLASALEAAQTDLDNKAAECPDVTEGSSRNGNIPSLSNHTTVTSGVTEYSFVPRDVLKQNLADDTGERSGDEYSETFKSETDDKDIECPSVTKDNPINQQSCQEHAKAKTDCPGAEDGSTTESQAPSELDDNEKHGQSNPEKYCHISGSNTKNTKDLYNPDVATKEQSKESSENPLCFKQICFKCGICGTQFRKTSEISTHMRTHTGEKPCKCDICGLSFAEASTLFNHMLTHTGQNPNQCDLTLSSHKIIHTREKPYKCNECGKYFSDNNNLSTHKRIHTGGKPYGCDVCGKSFRLISSLTVHKRIHTGEKPYKCDVCGKCFNSTNSVSKHMRTHTGEKPYTCNQCGKSFTQSSSLVLHKKNHTGENAYKCNECGKFYSCKFYLANIKEFTPEKIHFSVMCVVNVSDKSVNWMSTKEYTLEKSLINVMFV